MNFFESRNEKVWLRSFFFFVILAALFPWVSFFPETWLYRSLWTLQISNSYAPFTNSERLHAETLKAPITYNLFDTDQRLVKTILSVDLPDKVDAIHMARIPLKMLPTTLNRRDAMRFQAREIFKVIFCANFLNDPDLQNVQLESIKVVYDFNNSPKIQNLEIKCGS